MAMELKALQTEFATAYSNFLQVAKQLKPDKREHSGVCGHWSPKDVVSHLIGWDKALHNFIIAPESFDPKPLYNVDTFNAASVSERRHQPWEETVAELESSYRELEKAISTVTAEMKVYHRVNTWLKGRVEDYQIHKNQLEEWVDRR